MPEYKSRKTGRSKGFCVETKLLPSLTASSLLVVIAADNGILLVLVLGDKVPDVLVGLLELHLVHTLTLVPVEEGLALVHGTELGGQALEDSLEGGGVSDEGARGLVVDWGTLDDGVGVVGVALLADVINLLGGHRATEDQGSRHVLAIIGLHVGEEVTWAVDLVDELLHVDELVALVLLAGERSLGDQEEVQTRERHQVDAELPEVTVQLTRESERAGDTGHDARNEVVQIRIFGSSLLQHVVGDVV